MVHWVSESWLLRLLSEENACLMPRTHVKSLQRKFLITGDPHPNSRQGSPCISDRLARAAESRAWQKGRLPPLQVGVALFTFGSQPRVGIAGNQSNLCSVTPAPPSG